MLKSNGMLFEINMKQWHMHFIQFFYLFNFSQLSKLVCDLPYCPTNHIYIQIYVTLKYDLNGSFLTWWRIIHLNICRVLNLMPVNLSAVGFKKKKPKKSPMSKHLATVGRKNSLLTGRNLRQNQAQEGVATCRDRVELKYSMTLYKHYIHIFFIKPLNSQCPLLLKGTAYRAWMVPE